MNYDYYMENLQLHLYYHPGGDFQCFPEPFSEARDWGYLYLMAGSLPEINKFMAYAKPFKSWAPQYLREAVAELNPKHPAKQILRRPTYLYLMRDSRNGYVKIGRAKNPTVRERTLQSEQPCIELIEAWEADVHTERTLHKQYADKRIRGEWFALTDSDVQDILALR